MAKRYCIPCDRLVKGKECKWCGADTEPMPKGEQ
jgi:RNA polymerase subunit RPABC4/transcription elongation factor Spt4